MKTGRLSGKTTMQPSEQKALDELVRAGSLLSRGSSLKRLTSILVEQAIDITESDLACLYLYSTPEKSHSDLDLRHQRGAFSVPDRLPAGSELIEFIRECDETVVVHDTQDTVFGEALLHPAMQSGIVLPISMQRFKLGLLFLCSKQRNFFGRSRFQFLDSLANLAGGMLYSARAHGDVQSNLRRVKALERSRESIVSSLSGPLITTDRRDRITYYNERAGERLGLADDHLGKKLGGVLATLVDDELMELIEQAADREQSLAGVHGAYMVPGRPLNFTLNVTPLREKKGQISGWTYFFFEKAAGSTVEVQL